MRETSVRELVLGSQRAFAKLFPTSPSRTVESGAVFSRKTSPKANNKRLFGLVVGKLACTCISATPHSPVFNVIGDNCSDLMSAIFAWSPGFEKTKFSAWEAGLACNLMFP